MVTTRQIKAARACWGGRKEISRKYCIDIGANNRSTRVLDGPIASRPNDSRENRGALEKAGIEFIDENGGGPGVRLRKRQRPKKPK